MPGEKMDIFDVQAYLRMIEQNADKIIARAKDLEAELANPSGIDVDYLRQELATIRQNALAIRGI